MNIGNVRMVEDCDIRAAVCIITPNDAAELLKRNTHNRKISESVIDKYFDEMERGEWVPTSSGIGFDIAGVLSDGQQRLAAIIKHGRPVKMLVVAGLPVMAQEKVDRQRKRTMADVFALAGITKDKKPVQIATFLARISGRNNASDASVKDAYACHKDAILAVYAENRSNDRGISQVGVLAAVTLAYEAHGEKALVFLRKLKQDLYARNDDPCRMLRRSLTGQAKTPGAYGNGGGLQVWAFRKTLFAYNAFAHGRFITQVRESNEVEQ